MIPGEFEYHAPRTVEDAVGLLGSLGDGAKILAGGHSLVPAMRFRLALPDHLIDINGVPGLDALGEVDGVLTIGAMCREAALERAPVIAERYPLLADAAAVVADPLVRNRATVGGNVAHADPANDHPAVMLAYGATLVAQGPSGRREIAADDFFVGLFETALAPGEILVEIRIPAPASGESGAYEKMERKVGDYAVSAAAVQLRLDGDTCASARVALTNVSAVPMRATDAEAALTGRPITDDVLEAAGQAAAAECDPSADLRGSVEYKRDVTRILLKRAVRRAVARAKGGAS
ncbi:MAG: xanthine dehydrogenase family protein subunit M [Gemmatimonadota bacterium]|nr:xanthine dehydrogenase family protein subunit M [Gemmatimonadota bacterium]